jgi:hypothetical protein
VHNDAVVASWKVEALDSWGNTPPTSLIIDGWPGVQPEDQCGSFPCLSDVMPLCPNGWPDLSPHASDGVHVTVEVRSIIKGVKGYSACRSLVFLGYLSVLT